MTATQPVLRGIYWRCPECAAAVVVTMPNPMTLWLAAFGLDEETELDFRYLASTELEKSEALVEDHEDGHLLWRDFESSTR